MHENLKYTVRLNKKIAQCIDIEKQNDLGIKDWQPIFADKEYGTFYFIYGKFLGEKVIATNEFKLDRLQLYLQNFEGDVTIGITSKLYFYEQEVDSYDTDNRYPDRRQYGLFIILQAYNNNLSTVRDNDIIFPTNNMDVKLKRGDILVTRVFFRPVSIEIKNGGNQNSNKDNDFVVLDRLFEKRDGDSIAKIKAQSEIEIRELVENGIMSQNDFDEISESISEENIEIMGARRRCSPIISYFTIE
ncbi:MAG: hypothetical protein V3U92_02680 [Cellulophaga sp.]